MISRIIWTFKNNEMPRAYPAARSRQRPALSSSPMAGGPHLPLSQPRDVLPPARGTLARSSDRAPLFDATAERWIVPPSRMSRDAGAAAGLRHHQTIHTQTAGTRRARRSPLARTVLELLEFFVVVIGLGASAILSLMLWAVLA